MQNGSDNLQNINKPKTCKDCFAFVQYEKENNAKEKNNCATFLLDHCQKLLSKKTKTT